MTDDEAKLFHSAADGVAKELVKVLKRAFPDGGRMLFIVQVADEVATYSNLSGDQFRAMLEQAALESVKEESRQ